MVVIAMTREMGTLGKDVSHTVAQSLDLKIIYSELVEHDLAQRLGVKDSAVHHYLEGNPSLFERFKIDKDKLSQYTAEEILEFAQAGNVIIRGWGAVAVLRAVPHVLRVRVCAPMAFREKVIVDRLKLKSFDEARGLIEQNDAAHARLMKTFFGVHWENSQLYHLVLNTGVVPIDTCARLVRLLTDDPAFEATETSRSVLTDKLIESRVRTVLLDCASETGIGGGPGVAVIAGRVTLSGVIGPADNLALALTKIRQIDGVKEVNDEVRRAAQFYGV